MKKLFLFLFSLLIGVSLYSQSQAIELKTYCFGNVEHNLMSKLSTHSKLELEKILQENIKFYQKSSYADYLRKIF